ncbi:uncharacterized protein K441DRAFT_100377 [Cenococcum geophilum 1.58]|uniref:uncharacterized protein n=1 Tax=Cenococcum geophilum 1.58 TaxID=794803 RepID=UPI00358F5100|nr:hypothetical protein K441DRAFT_100377 [Cenococcum geophilum 1.58]
MMKAKRLREEKRKPPLDVGSWGFLWWSPLSLPRLAVFLIIGSGQPFNPRPDKFSHPSLPPPRSLFQPSPATVSETQVSQPGSTLSGPNASMPT